MLLDIMTLLTTLNRQPQLHKSQKGNNNATISLLLTKMSLVGQCLLDKSFRIISEINSTAEKFAIKINLMDS